MIKVILVLDRETKNSVRYMNSEFGTVYVPKHQLMRIIQEKGTDGWPPNLEMTLTTTLYGA